MAIRRIIPFLAGLLVFTSLWAAIVPTQVTLAWDPSDTPGVSYRVYASASVSGPWTAIGTTTGLTFVVPTLITATQSYHVRAFDATGESVPSNIVTVSPYTVPNPPKNNRATRSLPTGGGVP